MDTEIVLVYLQTRYENTVTEVERRGTTYWEKLRLSPGDFTFAGTVSNSVTESTTGMDRLMKRALRTKATFVFVESLSVFGRSPKEIRHCVNRLKEHNIDVSVPHHPICTNVSMCVKFIKAWDEINEELHRLTSNSLPPRVDS